MFPPQKKKETERKDWKTVQKKRIPRFQLKVLKPWQSEIIIHLFRKTQSRINFRKRMEGGGESDSNRIFFF